MARPKSFRDLIVWQKAMELARKSYSVTEQLPKRESFGLLSQIRRAAVSIPSNIAEGHGRLTDLQFKHFLGMARGSLCELQTQIELASDLGFVDRSTFLQLTDLSSEVARLINGLLASMKRFDSVVTTSNSANVADSASSATKGFHS